MENNFNLSCDLHDQLEAIWVNQRKCRLISINTEGKLSSNQGKIVAIYSYDNHHWCKLSDGCIIAFDRIETIEQWY